LGKPSLGILFQVPWLLRIGLGLDWLVWLSFWPGGWRFIYSGTFTLIHPQFLTHPRFLNFFLFGYLLLGNPLFVGAFLSGVGISCVPTLGKVGSPLLDPFWGNFSSLVSGKFFFGGFGPESNLPLS